MMKIDKAQTWRLAERLGGDALVRLIVEDTVTCYEGDRIHRGRRGGDLVVVRLVAAEPGDDVDGYLVVEPASG